MVVTEELVNVQLSQHAAALLMRAQEQGGYVSLSDTLEDVLQEWKIAEASHNSEEFRQICQAAIADDRPGVAPGPVFARLEQRFQSIVDASTSCAK